MLNIMIVFSIIAGIDKILGNRFGLGEKFDEGFIALGGLALTIIGIFSLSPVISYGLSPILGPLAKLIGTDPSVFISSILAPDLGGFPTSVSLETVKNVGQYNGAILGSMLGTLISFTIPVAVGIIKKDDFKYFAKGVLAGIMTVPIGMLVGGILLGIEMEYIIRSIFPVIIFCLLISFTLTKYPEKTIGAFDKLGSIIIKLSTLGLILVIITYFFNVEKFKMMYPLEEGAVMIFEIAIILSGAFPLFYFLSSKLHRYIKRIENRFGINQYSILGMISCLANCIPMFGIYDNMDNKGKVLNGAFVVSGAFTFGGQLAYISSVAPNATNAFIISKLSAGITAVILANYIVKKENI